jgi:hypothetical protein
VRRRRPFNNAKVTEVLSKYVRNPKNLKLRDEVMRLTAPLIEAAISKRRLFPNRADLRQECALKMLKQLDKFDPQRGSAFAFLWTMICNTLTTQNQRLQSSAYSIDTDETAKHEAEHANVTTETPETNHILHSISIAINQALSSNGFAHVRNGKKIQAYLLGTIADGDFFRNRTQILHRLEELGLKRRDAEHYIDKVLVRIRVQLLAARENAKAISVRAVGKVVPEELGA